VTSGEDPIARAAAEARVEATMAAAQRVQLTSLILAVPDHAVLAARRTATDVAAAAQRAGLLENARSTATRWVLQAFAQRGYSGTWAATDVAVSVARPADRAAVAEALADAVTADVVEDLVDAETADTLRSTWALLADAATIPEPGVLSGLTAALTDPTIRPSWGRWTIAAIVFVIGLSFLAGARPIGLVFVIAAAAVLANTLRGRPS
jgi:hypothetical protein